MGRKLYRQTGKRKWLWVLHVRQQGLKAWQHWDVYATKMEAKLIGLSLEEAYDMRILKYQLVKE